MFDISWIRDDLAVGGALPAGDLSQLSDRYGIRRVIDLRADPGDECERLSRHGVRHLHLPAMDFGALTPAQLDEGVAWIERAVAEGERVLVHCQLGIGRSVLLILCFLVKQGFTSVDALSWVKDRRARVHPSPQQIEALLEFENARRLQSPRKTAK